MTTTNRNAADSSSEPPPPVQPGRDSLKEAWRIFNERLGVLNHRLTRDLEECRSDLAGLLAGQMEKLENILSNLPTSPNLLAFQMLRTKAANQSLKEPLAQWEQRRPYKRALLAFEAFDRNLEELVRSLPETVPVAGPELLEALGSRSSNQLLHWGVRVRTKPFELPIRRLLVAAWQRLRLERSGLEGDFFRVIAGGIHQLRRNWEVGRGALDALAQAEPDSAWFNQALHTERHRQAGLTVESGTVLTAARQWQEGLSDRLATALLRGFFLRQRGKVRETDRNAFQNHLGEQWRALDAELRLETVLEQCEDGWMTESGRMLDQLGQEFRALREELDGFIKWLREQSEARVPSAVPPPQTEVVPSASRLAEFRNRVSEQLEMLPVSVLIRTKFSALPRFWLKPRELHPRLTAAAAFDRTGIPTVTVLLVEIEAIHSGMMREIERAREVLLFAMEETRQGANHRILAEAMQNALSLLEFHRAQATDWSAAADTRIRRALGAVMSETRLTLGRTQFGTFAYLGRKGAGNAASFLVGNGLTATRRVARLSFKGAERAIRQGMIHIGWIPAPRADRPEIVTRAFLPQEFTADLNEKELPAIYRRLFRFQAVEDPRFLVGRTEELEAIAQARAMWEAGRPVSVLIIGERGSGKTSLLNCALKHPLQGLEVTRGEFTQRLSNQGEVRAFLAGLVQAADSEKLEETLRQKPRVIILEELERTFLRQVGCYASVRELQKIIAATCSTTLWVVVMNHIAFRFLDASVGLGQSFSHRIDAARANREALREAIVRRHNLSGLRLQFALPPAERGWFSRFKNRLHGQADPEQIFFDQLSKESGGVFRSAFEIWLGQIDSVLSGVMYLKPLEAPDLAPVIDSLNQDDLFTLVAIMQHGSLTPDEHALVFQKGLAASQAQLDGLLAREIIEPDPGRPGVRVRPEALRVVQSGLYRRNLL
ncbi:MAG: ATP-binding protein [Blastocatellia bacterium]|nr:ATP-binding protein [Blastocatellia bacterium]